MSHDAAPDLFAALGRVPSGLFILTARHGHRETGMLASWVQQCSFDPPQLSLCLRRGRDMVFKLYLTTLMVPGVVTMIPNFALMVKLHLLDTYVGLIVPAAFSAFGTFLLRQFMLTLPRALDEAAMLDGATHWQTFWNVCMPLARPGLITLAVFTFMGTYGSFTWPLVMIKSEGLRTLPLGMMYFDSVYGRQTELIMAASVMNIIPLIILFVATQKHLVEGIQLGGVKG